MRYAAVAVLLATAGCRQILGIETRENDAGELVSVAKRSVDKTSIGGRKWALRRRTAEGVAEAEVVGIGAPPEDDGDDRALLVPLVTDGQVVGRETLEVARRRHVLARAELPVAAQQMSKGDPVIPTVFA